MQRITQSGGKLTEVVTENTTYDEVEAPLQRVRIYTRVLVLLCAFLWLASFFAFMGSEWLHTRQIPRYVKVVPRPPHSITLILRLSGAAAILVGAGGWWGALHHRHSVLCLFSSITFFTSVLEISCGSVTLSYAGKTTLLMYEDVVRDLNRVTDPKSSPLTNKFLELQKKIHCCGVTSYRDWIKSPWWKAQRNVNSSLIVPASCCIQFNKTAEDECSTGNPPYTEVNDPRLLHSMGCMQRVSDYMDVLFHTTGCLGFIGGLLKFIGFFGVQYLINIILKYQYEAQENMLSSGSMDNEDENKSD